MTTRETSGRLRRITADAVAEALGRDRRHDAVLRTSGGPAGNARLTAWSGLVLLVLFVAELLTLVGVRQLISWHLVLGALLVPPALTKTASTGWRILRYYTGNRPYVESGPPPLILRVLGPAVVISTLALLASGLALILTGPDTGRRTLVDVLGQRVDAVTIHQATFAVWAVVTGLHVLGRLLPAVRLTLRPTGTRVPGGYRRLLTLVLTMVVAVPVAVVVLQAGHAWRTEPERQFGRPGGAHHVDR